MLSGTYAKKGQSMSAGVTSGMKAGIANNVLSNIYAECRKRRQIGQSRSCQNSPKSHLGCCHLFATSSAFTAKQPRDPRHKQAENGAANHSCHSETSVKLIVTKLS